MSGVGRVQLNFELVPVKEIDVMAKLPQMIFPWLWIEETADIPEYLVNMLKYSFVLWVAKYILIESLRLFDLIFICISLVSQISTL